MKYRTLLIVLVAILTSSLVAYKAMEKEVPENVKTAFTEKFPSAEKIKWEMENAIEWESEFRLDGKEFSATFNLEGVWQETEQELEKKDIPEAVQQTLNNAYAGYEIEEVVLLENMDGTAYELELEKKETTIEVVIAPDGKVIKELPLESAGDEDDD
jgi:hypothetical protein